MSTFTRPYNAPCLAAFVFFIIFGANGQCPEIAATINDDVCTGENLTIVNTTDAESFEWDFCADELSRIPQAEHILYHYHFLRARTLDTFIDRNQRYMLGVNNASARVSLYGFGTSFANDPAFITGITISEYTRSPFGAEVIIENDRRVVFIAARDEMKIFRMDYGNSWYNEPTIAEMDVTFNSRLFSIEIMREGDDFIGFVSMEKGIARLRFGNDIFNSQPSTEVYPVPTANELQDLEFVNDCGKYTGLVTSYLTGELYSLNFQNGLLSEPITIGSVTNTGIPMKNPAGLGLARSGDSTYVLVQSARGNLYKGAVSGIPSGSIKMIDFGNLNVSTLNYPFTLVKEGPLFYGFSSDETTAELIRLTFPAPCDADQQLLAGRTPEFAYSAEGSFYASLTSRSSDGETMKGFTIDVSAGQAPESDFSVTVSCLTDPVTFTYSGNQAGNTFFWELGDGSTASGAQVEHTYASAGTFQVRLTVTNPEGCSNNKLQEIVVYEEVVADYSTSGQSCTNQEVTFVNASLNSVDGITEYEWYVDGILVSGEVDLVYEFSSAGVFEVTLISTTGTCSDVKISDVEVVDGPAPSFTVADACLGETSAFINTTTGSVTGWLWDFGDGNTSSAENPEHTYESPGHYQVTLTVYSDAGCITPYSATLRVAPKPVVNFAYDLACAAAAVQFADLSAAGSDNITGWHWDFGPSGTSDLQNPSVVFDSPGDYQVSLTVTTNSGCMATGSQVVSVKPAPVAAFSFGAACFDEPVVFTDESVPSDGTAITQWAWDFGPGFSPEQNPEHVFEQPGAYNVTLSVTASDQCAGTVSEVVVIPEQADVKFMAARTCTGQSTIFSDVTELTAPAVSRRWDFAGLGTATDSVAAFLFESTGTYQVTLEVETSNGCRYTTTQAVQITEAPDPAFEASVDSGAAPLTVVFTNTTSGGNYTYEWLINGTPVPGDNALIYTFDTPGEYLVSLRADDPGGCSAVTSRIISAGTPAYDLAANRLIQSFNGLLLEVTNLGNAPVSQVPVEYIGENDRESTVLTVDLGPGESKLIETPFRPLPNQQYLCLRIGTMIQGVPDSNPDNNSVCTGVEGHMVFSRPYPNPVTNGQLYVDLFTSETGELQLEWVNALGQEIPVPSYDIIRTGIYTLVFDISGLESGIYFIRVKSPGPQQVFRISIL